MGDGKVNKYAIIINGDTEQRHAGNVARAAAVLKKGGYKIHVASPVRPQVPVDFYTSPTRRNVNRMISGIRTDNDDEVVYYITGHGKDGKEVCLKNGCVRDEVVKKLDALKYGRRTVVMDQCYAGNLAGKFIDDPKTLFISTGSKGQKVCCNNFAPVFWKGAQQLKDLNRDGVISWQERFAAAYKGHHKETRLFRQSSGYRDFDVEKGKAARVKFTPQLTEVTTIVELKRALKKLSPGEYAVIGFSLPGCGGCDVYKLQFAAMAKKSGGRHLFIWSKSRAVFKHYGIGDVPQVRIIDAFGKVYKTDKRNIWAAMAHFDVGVVPGLIAALKHRSIYVRLKAHRALIKIKDKRAVPYFITALKDREPNVRSTAAEALGNIKDARAVPALIAALNDQYSSVSNEAMLALGMIKDTRALPHIIARLNQGRGWGCGGRAQMVLGMMEKDLMAKIKSRSPNVREKVVKAFGTYTKELKKIKGHIYHWREGYDAVVLHLIAALKDPSEDVRKEAADALSKARDTRTVPGLVAALKDRNEEVRWKAAAALGAIKNARAVPGLVVALKDQNEKVRLEATIALGAIKDARAVPGLVAALKDRNEKVRQNAAKALGKIKSVCAVPGLVAALEDRDVYVRRNAAEALGRIQDACPVPHLITALKDPDTGVRWYAVNALAQIGKSSVPRLIAALKDQNLYVRQRAAEALGKIKDARAIPHLIGALKDRDYYVRRNAMEALARIGKSAVSRLIAAFKDRSPGVRKRAIMTLLKMAKLETVSYSYLYVEARDPLKVAMEDRDRHVRKEAAKVLTELRENRPTGSPWHAYSDEDFQ